MDYIRFAHFRHKMGCPDERGHWGETIVTINDGKEWWREKWWMNDEYARLYAERISPQEVDRVIAYVVNIFDARWQREAAPHPVFLHLLAQGTLPLQFLYGLGKDIETVGGCLRVGHVFNDLRHPVAYGSALLELQTAATLKRAGHDIEFRPSLPNGKESDFAAASRGQDVYFEIKRMKETQSQQAMSNLALRVHFAFEELVRDSSHPAFSGKCFHVELDPGLTDLLGTGSEADPAIIGSVVQRIVQETLARVERDQQVEFYIHSLASVSITPQKEARSATNFPTPTTHSELKRFLRGHFLEAIEQLHPEHAGIVVVQTPAHLEQGITTSVVDGLLTSIGQRAVHVSAVVFFPTYNSMPSIWALFRPFAVTNSRAKFPPDSLKAFQDLQPMLQVNVSVPSEER